MLALSNVWLACTLLLCAGAGRAAAATQPDWTAAGFAGSSAPPYAGLRSFAGLPWTTCLNDQRARFDVALLGMPFDGGVSYRPGARFGPKAIREASRRQRIGSWSLEYEQAPYQVGLTFVDCDDVPITAYDPAVALAQMEAAYATLLQRAPLVSRDTERGQRFASGAQLRSKVIVLGGDHTVVLPILRALNKAYEEPIAVLHFDAHLDTWRVREVPGTPTAQSRINHGSFFAQAADEGLIDRNASIHAGLRCRTHGPGDITHDDEVGFERVLTSDLDLLGREGVVERIRSRIGHRPVYLSIDIDVLDPSAAPGTGTLETGGWTTRELHGILRGLRGLNWIGADIVEVSPPYDHAEITAYAASDLVFEIANLFAVGHEADDGEEDAPDHEAAQAQRHTEL